MKMTEYTVSDYEIAVIGAGHAGVEAALAAARLGCRTALLTLSMDLVGNMPCNPSIGGTGKGQLVCELNALGGEMGRAADEASLQSRILNAGKGPAVHSMRMQEDRRRYSAVIKRTLESQPGLTVIQSEAVEVRVRDGRVTGVLTSFGAFLETKAVVVCTGTSLGGRIIVGEASYQAGPDNTLAALRLTESLREAGVKLMRFKTGTPPRVHADSIDYSQLEVQEGDAEPMSFSGAGIHNTHVCYITYTNEETHRIIRQNLHRSPLFSGEIKGTGPRYCPSIEDKVVRFADKPRHQVFIEPMGSDTREMYLQGLSSSLPEEVQKQLVHSIKGLEKAVFTRSAYAIEYDCCDPTQLSHTLEFKDIAGLYGAGQFNGSSGYEEAAVQGFVAGVNAALRIKGRGPFVLSRAESYIGTLIDDLTVKGTSEPYRMMTSRSEYRLLLRQDNCDARLMKKGYELGLVDDVRYHRHLETEAAVDAEIKRLSSAPLRAEGGLNELLVSLGYAPVTGSVRASELLRRSGITYDSLADFDTDRPSLPRAVTRRVETELKYEGYIKRQLAQVEQFSKLEKKLIPPNIDYSRIRGLRIEAAQKLAALRPESIGQASRISGVSPADVSVLLVFLAAGCAGGGEED